MLYKNKFPLIVKYIPFVLLFVLMAMYHHHLPLVGDDLAYQKQILTFHWLYEEYTHWSSRMITESILITILHMPFVVWKLLNVILYNGPVNSDQY